MKQTALVLSLALCATSVAAENDDSSLIERGAQMLMEGLLREVEPALEDLQELAKDFGPALRDFATQMGPALQGILNEVEDWSVYHPPEILENGDIIIRRKTPDATVPDKDGAAIDL